VVYVCTFVDGLSTYSMHTIGLNMSDIATSGSTAYLSASTSFHDCAIFTAFLFPVPAPRPEKRLTLPPIFSEAM